MSLPTAPPSDIPTPYAGDMSPPPEVTPEVERHEADVLRRRKRFSWKKIGGAGFIVSVVFHFILVLIALLWVVRQWTEPEKKDTTFASGAGGGANGERAKQFEHKMQRRQPMLVKTPSRIVSRNANASIALSAAPATSTAAFASGLSGGGLSKGSGGGSGGGHGTGVGIGKGDGKNFVGRFLGMKVAPAKTGRVAVFMDASGSMTSYLDRVEAEAKKIFPGADVFRVNGVRTSITDGRVVGGRDSTRRNDPVPGAIENDVKAFSPLAKKIYREHVDKFTAGSVGAWFDIMISEKYDSLIIFSDFDDGITQTRGGTTVYADTPREQVDTRKSSDKAWENRWYRVLEKAKTGGAPRVYCFSIRTEPQRVWAKCAEISGGAVRMITWLTRPGATPPPEEEADNIAEEISRGDKRPASPLKPR